MNQTYVCAVDVGTGSARAGILDPAGRLLGRAHRFVMGKHSGLAAITASLSELKLQASPRELPAILARVRELAGTTKATVTAETLARILAEVRHATPERCA